MKELSHRERVRLAIDHKETDRVPMDLCGSTCNIVDPLYFKIKDYLGINGDIKPYRKGRTSTYYDERILEKLDIDFRHIWLNSPKSFKPVENSDGSYMDEWGVIFKKIGDYVEVIDFPLKNAEIQDLEKHTWPDTGDRSRVEGLKEKAEYLRRNTDYAISTKFVTSGGFLEHGGWLRGFEQFMIDMLVDEVMTNTIMDKIMDIKIELYKMMLEEVGEFIDVVEFAEDFGTQTSLLISPELYRKYMKPRYKKIIKMIKEYAPDSKIFFHSCGAVRRLISDLIDTGIEILNPIQPLAVGMNSRELKAEFGDKVCFHGGIDIQYALPGSIDDIRSEVQERIISLAKGGGYILAPTNHVQSDTSPENLIELYKYAKEFGKYSTLQF
jgi:uroporphyrinogen decarboxylase